VYRTRKCGLPYPHANCRKMNSASGTGDLWQASIAVLALVSGLPCCASRIYPENIVSMCHSRSQVRATGAFPQRRYLYCTPSRKTSIGIQHSIHREPPISVSSLPVLPPKSNASAQALHRIANSAHQSPFSSFFLAPPQALHGHQCRPMTPEIVRKHTK
jgi:hypothetical protein